MYGNYVFKIQGMVLINIECILLIVSRNHESIALICFKGVELRFWIPI